MCWSHLSLSSRCCHWPLLSVHQPLGSSPPLRNRLDEAPCHHYTGASLASCVPPRMSSSSACARRIIDIDWRRPAWYADKLDPNSVAAQTGHYFEVATHARPRLSCRVHAFAAAAESAPRHAACTQSSQPIWYDISGNSSPPRARRREQLAAWTNPWRGEHNNIMRARQQGEPSSRW
jgi:hypothetical protein